MENLELYQEEQRELLLDLNKGIHGLSSKLQEQIDSYEVVKNVEVSGQVQVNTEKTVEVSNLESLQDAVKSLEDTLHRAITDNSYKPLESVTVKNIKDALPTELKITNLSDIAKYFINLEQSIKNNQPIVNVQKQEVVFPTDPKKPLPVRLSDGKKFYEALTAAVGGGMDSQGIINAINNMSVSVDTTGLATEAKQDATITAINSISAPSTRWALYADARQDLSADPMYFGKEDATGNWVIKRFGITSQTSMYYEGTGGIGSNWAGRAGYTYLEFNAL